MPGSPVIPACPESLGIGETLGKEVSTGLTTLTPRARLEKLMEENLPSEGPDFVIGKAVVEGLKGKCEVACKYSFLDYSDEKTGLSAMARCTDFSAEIVARDAGEGGRLRRRGSCRSKR